LFAAGEKVVEADDFTIGLDEPVAKMGAKKTRSAGDENAHELIGLVQAKGAGQQNWQELILKRNGHFLFKDKLQAVRPPQKTLSRPWCFQGSSLHESDFWVINQ
jgi:hypothetical protein